MFGSIDIRSRIVFIDVTNQQTGKMST